MCIKSCIMKSAQVNLLAELSPFWSFSSLWELEKHKKNLVDSQISQLGSLNCKTHTHTALGRWSRASAESCKTVNERKKSRNVKSHKKTLELHTQRPRPRRILEKIENFPPHQTSRVVFFSYVSLSTSEEIKQSRESWEGTKNDSESHKFPTRE